jgi:cation transport ATPase
MADELEDSSDEPDLTREDIHELIQTQQKQVEVEKEKQKTRRQELESEERKAKHALEAQLKDRERAREYQNKINQRNQRYGLVIISIAVLFLGYLVWLGHTGLVFEIIRVLVYGGSGAIAGNAYGKAQAQIQMDSGNGAVQ